MLEFSMHVLCDKSNPNGDCFVPLYHVLRDIEMVALVVVQSVTLGFQGPLRRSARKTRPR